MTNDASHAHAEIRPLAPDWSSALGRLFAALRAAGDERWFHPFPLDDASAAHLATLTGADRYLIATVGAEVVAFGMLRGWDDGYQVPSLGIAVAPASQGAGLGLAMMTALHAEAIRGGAKRIRLKVQRDNYRAIELYVRLGYVFEATDGAEAIGYVSLGDD